MATTYTFTNANGKAGSIVITPSAAGTVPRSYLNLKNAYVRGSNPFLADNATLNPQASIAIIDRSGYIVKDMLMSSITAIGGSATPATLALTIAALEALIAE